MPKSFRLRQNRSNTPTSNTSVHVEVGASEVELKKELASLKAQIKANLTEEFTKLKDEIKAKAGGA